MFNMPNQDLAALSAVFVPMIVFYVLLFGVLIVSYVLSSIGLFRMAKARSISNCWLAWIPYGRDWLLGKISGDLKFGNRTVKRTPLWLLLIPIIITVVVAVMYVIIIVIAVMSAIAAERSGMGPHEFMPMIFSTTTIFTFSVVVVTIALSILSGLFFYMAYYQVYSQYKETGTAVFYLLLALFVPLANSILLYRVSGMPLLNTAQPEPAPQNTAPAPEPAPAPAPDPAPQQQPPQDGANAENPQDNQPAPENADTQNTDQN